MKDDKKKGGTGVPPGHSSKITYRTLPHWQRQIYPVEGTEKNVSELKTIGIELSKDQAIYLARVLLAVSQEWEEIEITAYRLKRRSDGTYQITVTSYQS